MKNRRTKEFRMKKVEENEEQKNTRIQNEEGEGLVDRKFMLGA